MKRFAFLCVTSCAWLSTEPYTATRDMKLYVTIDGTVSPTHVTADLTGPVGRVALGPNDSLSLAIDGASIVSSRVTSFDVSVAPRSGDFAFSVHHEGDHDVTAHVTLVPASNIHATSAPGKLLLDWTAFPNAGATTLTVSGACIRPQTVHVQTDTGHYEILAAQLQALPAACSISLALSRDLQTQIAFLGETFMFATVSQAESGEGAWTP